MSDRHRLILLLPCKHCKPSRGGLGCSGFGVFGGVGAAELIENEVSSSEMVTKLFFLEDALPARETTQMYMLAVSFMKYVCEKGLG